MDIKNIELKDYLQKLLGEELSPFLQSRPEPAAIRINRLKTTRKKFLQHLGKLGQTYRVIPFNPDGLIIDHDDLPLSHSLAFFTGQFNYQGIASQLPVILLDVRPGEKVLDMAASPGSKSTQIAGHLQQTGLLILNDPSMERLQALNANMQKSGAVNHYTLKMRGERFGTLYPEYFDKVLIDAPCTALGNLSENHEVHHWWSLEKLRKLNHVQDHMLIAACKSLKAGGEMVYSTCSVAPEENELVVQRLLDKYPVSVLPPPGWIARRFDQGYSRYRDQRLHPDLCHAVRVLPHKHQMEGFFAVRLRKEDAFKNDPDKHIDLSPTMIPTDPDVAPILEMLSETWGIKPEIWTPYRFLLTKTRIWMTAGQVEVVPRKELISAGLLLAEKRISGWKLVNASAQYFRKKIKKRTLELDPKDLVRLFYEMRIPFRGEKANYYILTCQGEPIASVYSSGTALQLRSSHRYRLVI